MSKLLSARGYRGRLRCSTGGRCRGHRLPSRRGEGPAPAGASPCGHPRSVSKLKAWMLVLPMDTLALSAPAMWMPQHAKGFLAMAALSSAAQRGGRYRARLHVSVLDELPILLGRMLAAGGIVATVFAIRHEQTEVTTFLATAVVGMGLVVLGRILSNQIILLGRRRRIVAHRTVIVGGGTLASELLTLLNRYPQYGLLPCRVRRRPRVLEANAVSRRLGARNELEDVVRRTAAPTSMLVADSELPESQVLDAVRQPRPARRGRHERSTSAPVLPSDRDR